MEAREGMKGMERREEDYRTARIKGKTEEKEGRESKKHQKK